MDLRSNPVLQFQVVIESYRTTVYFRRLIFCMIFVSFFFQTFTQRRQNVILLPLHDVNMQHIWDVQATLHS